MSDCAVCSLEMWPHSKTSGERSRDQEKSTFRRLGSCILLLGPQNGIGFSRLRDQQHGEHSDGKSDDDRWVLNVASPWDKSLGEDHLRDHSILIHMAGHRFEALTLKLSVPAFFADLACVVADVK